MDLVRGSLFEFWVTHRISPGAWQRYNYHLEIMGRNCRLLNIILVTPTSEYLTYQNQTGMVNSTYAMLFRGSAWIMSQATTTTHLIINHDRSKWLEEYIILVQTQNFLTENNEKAFYEVVIFFWKMYSFYYLY